MTEPGQPCPICRLPDPDHDWDEHERHDERWDASYRPTTEGPRAEPLTGTRITIGGPDGGGDVQPLTAAAMWSSSRGGTKVVWLAVHTTEGIMRATDLRAWSSWPGSSHASNDETGTLLTPAEGFVPYDRAAWTLRNGNPRSENIEQCGWARWTREQWLSRPKLLQSTARWLADRSQARNIPLRRLTLAQVRAGEPGCLEHADYTRATGDGTHTDCGDAYPWDVVLDLARGYVEADTKPEPTTEDPDVAFTDEQAKRLDNIDKLVADLHYGLRRPVVNGDTMTAAMRDVQNRVKKLDAQHPDTGPVTATAVDEDEPVAPWTDEQVDLLAEQLEAELSPEQVASLVHRIQP